VRHFVAIGLNVLENVRALPHPKGARLMPAGVTGLSAPTIGLPGPNLTAKLVGAPPRRLDRAARPPTEERPPVCRKRHSLATSGHTYAGMILGFDGVFAGPMTAASRAGMRSRA